MEDVGSLLLMTGLSLWGTYNHLGRLPLRGRDSGLTEPGDARGCCVALGAGGGGEQRANPERGAGVNRKPRRGAAS